MARFEKKSEVRSAIPPSPVLSLSESVMKCYPVLLEYMTCDQFGDGEARRTSTLTFFAEEGGLKGCLSDREAGLVTFLTGSSFEEVLGGLEASLAGETAVWRPSRKSPGKGSSKKGSSR